MILLAFVKIMILILNNGGIMNNLNQIYLLGNLTKDPEIKYTNEGMAITEMGLAINKRWKDNNGEDVEIVDYFNVTSWNALAENCAGTLRKGDRIIVSGHLNLRSWESKEGKKYNIINVTADVVAASLEFCKLKIADKKVKKIDKGSSPDKVNNPEKENLEES
jgi:single-strand DNA-binding protein